MYKPISNYGVIVDLHTVALIDSDGSIDWLCLTFIDSPSVFGAILDDRKGGSFSLHPIEDWDSYSKYIPQTNILTTTFRTGSGIARITDFMPVSSGGEQIMEKHVPELYRMLAGCFKRKKCLIYLFLILTGQYINTIRQRRKR